MSEKPKRVATVERVYCNRCRGTTLHGVLKTALDEGSAFNEYVGDVWWSTSFQMLQCRGCGEAVLRRTHVNSENEEPEVTYFPPPVSRHPPNWRFRLPSEMRFLLDEVYRSLDADSHRLSLMGARTLVDMLMMEKVDDIGSFKQKLKALEKAGIISATNSEVLDAALDAGSAAAHRGYSAQINEVQAVMDIVENMLQAIYVLPHMAQRLKRSTPPRSHPKVSHPKHHSSDTK